MTVFIKNKLINKLERPFFTDFALKTLLGGTPDRRYGLVKRAMAKGEIVQLRRGLYVLSDKQSKAALNLFELAHYIYGPSYISFESALSYHGLIPETVHTVTSACSNRSRQFQTPLGHFSYTRVPVPTLMDMVERIEIGSGCFFMAHPWRALADTVYALKKNWAGIHPLTENLRIEEEALRSLDRSLLDHVKILYTSKRVRKFIRGLKKDLST